MINYFDTPEYNRQHGSGNFITKITDEAIIEFNKRTERLVEEHDKRSTDFLKSIPTKFTNIKEIQNENTQ